MHHSHHGMPAFFIFAGVALVFVVVVAALTVLIQRRMYAGPLQDRWFDARRGLTFQQRRELWWANAHHRLVGRPELGPAQLARTRYVADSYRRAPVSRHRWIRVVVPMFFLAEAAFQLIPALSSPHPHVASLIAGGGSLVAAVSYCYLALRGLRKGERKVNDLQQQLQDRYGWREGVV